MSHTCSRILSPAPTPPARRPPPAPHPASALPDFGGDEQPWWKRAGGGIVAAALLLFGQAQGGPAVPAEAQAADHLGHDARLDRGLQLIWGWKFALGFVVLLFVHEMGHVIQLRREGVKASAPVFIPFFGAAVWAKSLGDDALAEARVGLAGPVLGTIGAAACLPIAERDGQRLLARSRSPASS